MSFIHDLWFAFWIFLPAGIANMAPIFAAHTAGLKNLEFPMDFGLSMRARRIFGPHKTIRGLVMGIIFGILAALIESKIFGNQYPANPYIFGLLLSFGALAGDAVKSFFKRQWDIPSGDTWLFFDQLDYILGGIVFSVWYLTLGWQIYLYIIIIYFVLHLVITWIGNWLGLKQNKI